MSNMKKVVFENVQKVIKREVKRQEDSACFLLGYQPKFPEKVLSRHSEKE